jgi:hypothetical protein
LEVLDNSLNEKLLKFAGITVGFKQISKDATNQLHKVWTFPDGTEYFNEPGMPDLVNDANKQIKWLYPKIISMNYAIYIKHLIHSRANIFRVEISDQHSIIATDESPTMAFALCCEKLIDSLEKK